MAFRYEGYNWEGREWQTVPAITALGLQIEEVRPGTWATDGTVASKSHDINSPTSDHSPDADDGDVAAIDFGGGKAFLDEVTEQLRLSRDPRIKYVIYNERMFSSYARHGYDPYTWRPYSGANGHKTHAHVSVTTAGEQDASEWQLQEDSVAEPAPLTAYEQAAIDSLLEDGVFTQWTVDEDGEVHADVALKKLAVFLMRIKDQQEAADAALQAAIDAIPRGEDAKVEIYIDGERVR